MPVWTSAADDGPSTSGRHGADAALLSNEPLATDGEDTIASLVTGERAGDGDVAAVGQQPGSPGGTPGR